MKFFENLSLLETAKRHGLDAEKYMTYLLEHLPNEVSLAKKEDLEAYFPWDKNIKRAYIEKGSRVDRTLEPFSIYLVIGWLRYSTFSVKS